ncbi:hypothetical protein OD350_09640 [Clostridium beijerinckii]|uniref:hypothetical protein n=1 Tax=Clostridium beijerinckii TaxID=1520 RepID=UPI0022278EC5|nr:hypothetical protein [Clostridium beijerinckii]UYZ37908.1 hypothetical protein OD350_09640 [Clostridium beijerinckii]
MAFLDEKIAQLQKQALIAKKHDADKKKIKEEESEKIKAENIIELTQEEVTQAIKNGLLEQNEEKLIFENKTFFHGKLVMPMFKDFFDEFMENESLYCWSKKHVFSALLSKSKLKEDINNVNDLTDKMKSSFKEKDIYIELLSSMEDVNENYSKYTITTRMPTALDYMYQYMVYFKYGDEIINLIFTCLEKDKRQWEKIMVGISELIEINEGDILSNE